MNRTICPYCRVKLDPPREYCGSGWCTNLAVDIERDRRREHSVADEDAEHSRRKIERNYQ